jgi:hypothetical protein
MDDSLGRRWGWGEDGHEGDDLALGREMWNNGQVVKKLSLGDWGQGWVLTSKLKKKWVGFRGWGPGPTRFG